MTVFLRTPPLFASLAALLFLAACSGTNSDRGRAQREPAEELPDPAEGQNIVYADYETFDAAPYRDEAPERQAEIRHQVPEKLMEGRAAEGVTRVVRGYRIQILSTADREEADKMVGRALAWWRARQDALQNVEEEDLGEFPEPAQPTTEADTSQVAPEGEEDDELTVDLVYIQPYWRVRIGDFVEREEAARFREEIEGRFPGAFIVPDMITLTR